ncbi:MAG: hypothetical protein K2Z81_02730, partial [Cyanobacteria bacterium]|nr:hypothetical protein [Cyanobacteriota bacterium]
MQSIEGDLGLAPQSDVRPLVSSTTDTNFNSDYLLARTSGVGSADSYLPAAWIDFSADLTGEPAAKAGLVETSFTTDVTKPGVEVVRDAQGRITSVKQQNGHLLTVEYDEAGKMRRINDGGKIWWTSDGGSKWTSDTERVWGTFTISPDGTLQKDGVVQQLKSFSDAADLTEVLYQRLFKRGADAGSNWAQDMFKLGLPYKEVVRMAINNALGEFKKSIPTQKEEIVPFLYQRLLGRTERPTQEEMAVWNQLLETAGVDAVINGLLESDEFKAKSPTVDKLVVDANKVVEHLRTLGMREKVEYLAKVMENYPDSVVEVLGKLDKREAETIGSLLTLKLLEQLRAGWKTGPEAKWYENYPTLSKFPDFIKQGPLPPGTTYEGDPAKVMKFQFDLFMQEFNKGLNQDALLKLMKLAPFWDKNDSVTEITGIDATGKPIYTTRSRMEKQVEDAILAGLTPDSVGRRFKNLPELLAQVKDMQQSMRRSLTDRLVRLVCGTAACDYGSATDPAWRLDALKMLKLFPDQITAEQARQLAKFCRVPGFIDGQPGQPAQPGQPDVRTQFPPHQEIEARQIAAELLRLVAGYSKDPETFKIALKAMEGMPKPPSMEAGVVKNRFGDEEFEATPELLEDLKKIEEIYGRRMFEFIEANLDLVNGLPPAIRAEIMGWTKLPDEQKKLMGWFQEPPPEMKEKLKWDQLSELQRENLRWNFCRVDADKLLGILANGKLNQSIYAALGGNLGDAIEQAKTGWYRKLDGGKLTELQKSREEILKELRASTTTADFWSQVEGIGRDKKLQGRQKELVDKLNQIDAEIKKSADPGGDLTALDSSIKLAWQQRRYRTAWQSGDKQAAAGIALNLFKEYGPALKIAAPGIWKDLTGAGRFGEPLLKGGMATVPVHGKDVPAYDATVKGFKQALGLEPITGQPESFGLCDLQRGKSDYDAWKATMMLRIDSDESLKKTYASGSEVSALLTELTDLLQAGERGTVYENYIDLCKEKAAKLEAALKNVTEKDLKELQERITLLQEAYKKLFEGKPFDQIDQDLAKQLGERIHSLKQMHNLLNRGEPVYRDVLQKDKAGKEILPNKQIEDLIKKINQDGLQPSSLMNWFKENAPAVIAVAAGTAVVIATWGTASPLVVGLASAVAGVAAGDVSAEILYQINKGKYTGIGGYDNPGAFGAAWYRSLDSSKSDMDVVEEFVTKVIPHYVGEVGRDWLLFLVTAGIVGKTCGGLTFKETISSLAKAPPPNFRQLAFRSSRRRVSSSIIIFVWARTASI